MCSATSAKVIEPRHSAVSSFSAAALAGCPIDTCPAHTYYDRTMTIVAYRPRKRPAKAGPATIKVPRIVQHTPRGRAWKLPEPDPEGEARAAAFLAG